MTIGKNARFGLAHIDRLALDNSVLQRHSGYLRLDRKLFSKRRNQQLRG
jgi:hypothetical protein